MTTPNVPTRAGDLLKLESRAAPCPTCNGDSIEIRYAPPAYLSEQLKARLDPERPFIAQQCARCLAELHAAEQRRQLERLCATALTALDVPKLYADVSLETFEAVGVDSDLLAMALAYAQNYIATWPDVPLISVFSGACGTGKGHLMWSIAKDLAATRGVTARVVVLSDVVRDLREAWDSSDGPTEAQRLGKYRQADLLAIDEVSRHAFFGQPQQHLYDLVAWREVRMKPTILTSNELGADLSSVLGPALSSRAIGADGFVNFGTRDWRVANKRRRLA